jgi:hypothetical protein
MVDIETDLSLANLELMGIGVGQPLLLENQESQADQAKQHESPVNGHETQSGGGQGTLRQRDGNATLLQLPRQAIP